MTLKKKQSGQGMTEYILIVALIAVAVIAALKIFQRNVSNSFGAVGTQLTGSTASGLATSNSAN